MTTLADFGCLDFDVFLCLPLHSLARGSICSLSHQCGGFGSTEVCNNSPVEWASAKMGGTTSVCITANCDCSVDVFQISTSRFFDFDVLQCFQLHGRARGSNVFSIFT